MYSNYCGIDFGTTNSAISVVKDGNTPSLVTFEKDKTTIPSAIFFPEDTIKNPIFGTKALQQYFDGEQGRFMRSLKRILGTDLMTEKTDVNGYHLYYEDIIYLYQI